MRQQVFSDREALIALNMVRGVGAALVGNLTSKFGSPRILGQLEPEDMTKVRGCSLEKARAIFEMFHSSKVSEELEYAEKCSSTIITQADDLYPKNLNAIQNPPLVLYVTGETEALKVEPSIAVIGTRKPSLYGDEIAKSWSLTLAEAGVAVVSGLAEGIDTAAHKGALLAKRAPTIAVVGSALNQLYPATNKPLAREIVKNGGAVISEYPFGRHADAQTFPMRNRIVAGLVRAVLIVECPHASGTLITAHFARELQKTIYAVPGRLDMPGFRGNHELLKEGEATLVTRPGDILENFLSFFNKKTLEENVRDYQQIPDTLSADERTVLCAIQPEGSTPEEISAKCNLPIATILTSLIYLEMSGLTESLPGSYVRRK